MQITTALSLIANVVYKPGWRFECADHSDRFEGTITVTVHYPARNTDRDQAPDYPTSIDTRATFPLCCGGCDTQEDLLRCLFDLIMEIECHEAREYFRVSPTYWAPFHPHRIGSIKRYAATTSDYHFGIA